MEIKSTMLRFVRSVRLQRGGWWRALRVGVVVVVVVVWAWVFLLSSPTHTLPNLTRADWSSRSPNLQVAAPISDGRGAPPPPWHPHPPVGRDGVKPEENGIIAIETKDKLKKIERGENTKNKRNQEEETNLRLHRGQEDKVNEGNHREDNAIPKIFPQRRIILPGDTRLVVEEEEDEEEEEEEQEEEVAVVGKWNGRKIEDKDNNHAMEEVDEAVGIGDDDNNNNNNDDDFVEEDVGGEPIKKEKKIRKRRGEKPRSKPVNEKIDTIKRIENDLVNDNHHRHHQEQDTKSQIGNNNPPELDLDLEAVEEDMRVRRSRIKQVCARHGLGPHASPGGPKVKYPPTPNFETFYIDRGDRLAWCPVYKAASTSWLYGFLSLAGISESYMRNTKEQVSTVARRVWPVLPYEEAKEAMGMCVKAFVVRHPFERLASAFRDKLERIEGGEKHGTQHFYQKYGRNIVKKYRKKKETLKNLIHYPENHQNPLQLQLLQPQPPPPPQRYSNALDDQPVPPPQPQPLPPQRYRHIIDESPPPQGKEPTFAEFVQYLIDTDLTLYVDDHWMPYSLSCTPCLLDFDVVAKFETLDRDQAFLLHKTGLQGKLNLSWRHLTKGNRTADVIKSYFADVPKKHLLSLYGKYRLDFEMFDYSVADYLSYVSS